MDLLFTLRVRLHDGVCMIRAFDGGYICGRNRIEVSVRMNGRDVFPLGLLYCGPSPFMSIDGIEAKELVMSLVGMKPGDTDAEYFADYTPEQLEWANRYGEEIQMHGDYRYSEKVSRLRRNR